MSDDSASPADLVGTILAGRYRIVQRLGEGAMGAVYLGEHIKMGRRDAIKVLRESLATDREATLRFLRGARTVSSIRHPNVCTIYDFSDTADGLQFLAMEFVAGETLKDLLDRERRLPVERAVAIAIQVAEALDAAHDVGVVHRDLKPGNIMLVRGRDGRDVVKVVDFDIAKGPDAAGEEVTRMGFVVGTPEYMSPEQLMGEALNGRSDVYSLALVLFRMLTGALPFQAETTQDVMIQRLTHAPLRLTEALPDGVFPARLQQAIERALDRRAPARPDATEFSRELAASLVDAGAVAAPAGSGTGAGAAHSRSAAPPAELPATRVSPASPANAAGGVANNARGRRRRNIAIAAAVVVVAVIGASAMLRGGAQPADGGGNAVTPDASPVIPAETAVITPPPAPPASPPAGPQRNRETTAERDDPAPERDDPPPVPGIVIDSELVNSALFRQLDRFPPVAEAAPNGAMLAAIIDTASAVWGLTEVAPPDRALAAYVLGEAHNARRDWLRCVQWLDSALVLKPGDVTYTSLRTSCHGQIR